MARALTDGSDSWSTSSDSRPSSATSTSHAELYSPRSPYVSPPSSTPLLAWQEACTPRSWKPPVPRGTNSPRASTSGDHHAPPAEQPPAMVRTPAGRDVPLFTFIQLDQVHTPKLRQRAQALRDAFRISVETDGNASAGDAATGSAGALSAALLAPFPADRGALQAWILEAQIELARLCGHDAGRRWAAVHDFGAPPSLARCGNDAELLETTPWDGRQLSLSAVPAVRGARDGLGMHEKVFFGREAYTWMDMVVDAGKRPHASRSTTLSGSVASTPRQKGDAAAAALAAARANLGLSVPSCADGPFYSTTPTTTSSAPSSPRLTSPFSSSPWLRDCNQSNLSENATSAVGANGSTAGSSTDGAPMMRAMVSPLASPRRTPTCTCTCTRPCACCATSCDSGVPSLSLPGVNGGSLPTRH